MWLACQRASCEPREPIRMVVVMLEQGYADALWETFAISAELA